MYNQLSTEITIMPSRDGNWYWEVVTDRNEVRSRGIADTVEKACEQAREAAKSIH